MIEVLKSDLSGTMADPIIRGDSLYTIVDSPSWTQAEANSAKLGGHLVTINSKEEDVWLSKNVYGNQYIINGGTPSLQDPIKSYYIGYNDISTEGIYRWSSGAEVTYNGIAPSPTYDPSHPNAVNTDAFVVNSNADGSTGHWINVDDTASWYRDGNIPVVSVDIKAIIESHFVRRGDSAYVVVQGPTWEEAEANAVKLGGHLVTINDSAENEWILGTFRNDFPNGAGFIGYTDSISEGNWTWSSGERTSFSNWDTGNPSNSGGVEDVGTIQFGDGSWNDIATNYWNWFGNQGDIKGIAEIKLAPNIIPTGTPALVGTVESGKSISIDKTPIRDGDNFEGYTPSHKYSWESASDPGMTQVMPVWEALNTTDATDGNNSIALTKDLEGKLIRGVVQYMDGHGTNEVVNTNASKVSTTPPTYSITQSPTPSVAEGATLTTTVRTTDLPQGTQVFWSAGGTGIDADDFSSGALTGTATVGADGKFSFSHTLATDSKTEGNETLQVKLYSDSARTTQVGTTASTTVTDTSKTPTYTVTQSPTPAVAEGATLTTSVQTTELAQGTKVFWSASGTNIDASDFSAGALTGESTVDVGGKFTFSHTLKNDNKTEGSETLQVKLYSDSARTTQVGTTASTTVTDTSKNPPPIVNKEDGDAHASVNENLARGAHSLIGMRHEKLNVDGDADFESDLDSTSDTSATTANGNSSTISRHSILGIELNGSSRIGGEGRFASIVTHEGDNEATASNGTADTEEHISSVSVDVSDLAIHGKSSFGSYMSVGATNRADASQSSAGVVVTDATATLNKDLAPNERSITGMRFERLTTDDSATFRSELENSVDTRATSDNGNASVLSNNSILGVGFSGTSRIGGDARVTSILTHNSFSDAQSVHGTVSANEHNSIIGIEADNLSIQGNATFSSNVVVRAGSNSGT